MVNPWLGSRDIHSRCGRNISLPVISPYRDSPHNVSEIIALRIPDCSLPGLL
jgi:hypothetical protein